MHDFIRTITCTLTVYQGFKKIYHKFSTIMYSRFFPTANHRFLSLHESSLDYGRLVCVIFLLISRAIFEKAKKKKIMENFEIMFAGLCVHLQ